MLSRVANLIFWTARYLERAEVDEEAHQSAAIPVAKAWQAYSISRNALAKRVTKLQKR